MSYTPPPDRAAQARSFAAELRPGQRVCLTTHVNPDGDGLGSEVALVHLLRTRGIDAVITNPSPTPSRFGFLFRGLPGVDRTNEAVKELRRADLIIVLDISDLNRLGMLIETVRDRGVPVACVDHHVSVGVLPPGPRYVDAGAAATGELIFELARANGWEVSQETARALYVAILTDTGGFRFSNTHPRTLRIAADLLETGVDPEQIYLEVYARAPEGRPRLFAEALQTLVVEPEYGLAWVTVPPGSIERHGVTSDDLDGVVEFPRSIEGVRMALLFREIAQGRVKVSLRSVGDVDVAAFAKNYGGGGHTKAAGLSLVGSLAEVQSTVLTAAREYLGTNGAGSQESEAGGLEAGASQAGRRQSDKDGRTGQTPGS
jgi:bifunctional oligoribonuclease and PAP phosphatase NrnA